MFEELAVVPLYLTILVLTNSEKDLTWEQQVYMGTSCKEAYEYAYTALKEKRPKDTTDLKAFIRYYHIEKDGKIYFITDTEV